MSGVILPTSVAAPSSWVVADFLDESASSAAATGGRAVVDLGQLGDEVWLIDHAVVHCTSTEPTALRFYDSAIDPLRLLDGSRAGNFDVADWPAGLRVRPSTSLLAVWEGASDGAVGTVTLQGRILRRG